MNHFIESECGIRVQVVLLADVTCDFGLLKSSFRHASACFRTRLTFGAEHPSRLWWSPIARNLEQPSLRFTFENFESNLSSKQDYCVWQFARPIVCTSRRRRSSARSSHWADPI